MADLYDRYRPGYPSEVFTRIAEYAQLEAGAPVLEVGAGTGQATIPLAGLGIRLTALEPDRAMARVLRRRAGGLSGLDIVASTFEEWPAPQERFRLVVSAQAWHWVDLEIRYRKAHLVLAPQASLALIWNRPFAPDGEQPLLRAKVAAAYRELAPDLNPALPGERAQDRLPEIEASGLFRSLEHERRTWGVTYSAEGWLGLLRTQSDHRLLPPGQLEALLRRLRAALEEAGGSMPTTYENHLYLGRRND